MTNESKTEGSIILGILLALGGALVGTGLWLAVIAIVNGGTGGAIGGAIAAVIGMLVAGGYRKGSGRSGFIGFLTVIVFVLASVITAVTLGTSIIIFREGLGNTLLDSFDILLDLLETDTNLAGAFAQDLLITAGIAIVLGLTSLFGGKKKNDSSSSQPEQPSEDNE